MRAVTAELTELLRHPFGILSFGLTQPAPMLKLLHEATIIGPCGHVFGCDGSLAYLKGWTRGHIYIFRKGFTGLAHALLRLSHPSPRLR
mmetsp:Transcript_100275/g.169350  ORF Transcript_100275/g.169350 Transcript_100275/m.169350 type:complete len:89 (-) Transcript_100275:251-517(-)